MYDLYHPRIFELAAEIPHIGRQGRARAQGRQAGQGPQGRQAGQGARQDGIARVSPFPAPGPVRSPVPRPAEIADALDALRAMLKAAGPPPPGRFWELRHLEGVREYPARHLSIMLAWQAALAACEAAATAQPHALTQAEDS